VSIHLTASPVPNLSQMSVRKLLQHCMSDFFELASAAVVVREYLG
jgi:hypothetical protein